MDGLFSAVTLEGTDRERVDSHQNLSLVLDSGLANGLAQSNEQEVQGEFRQDVFDQGRQVHRELRESAPPEQRRPILAKAVLYCGHNFLFHRLLVGICPQVRRVHTIPAQQQQNRVIIN
jgi:hypothetical protein